MNHTQFCQPFCLLGVCTTNHPKQEFRFQTEQTRYVSRSRDCQECFTIDQFPSLEVLQVEDDCGVVISDRGMITYSNFIVGITHIYWRIPTIFTNFSPMISLPGFLGFDLPIGAALLVG